MRAPDGGVVASPTDVNHSPDRALPLDVSILICTHNSEAVIADALRHLRNQLVGPSLAWEVLVVDFQSTDGTKRACSCAWDGCDVAFRFLSESRPGKARALETGLTAAKGEAVCIVDDDNWVFPSYVETAHDVMSTHPDVGAIGAHGVPYLEDPAPYWFERYAGVYAVGHQADSRGYLSGRRNWFWGAGTVVRNSAWRAVASTGFEFVLNPSREGAARTFRPGYAGGEDQELSFALQHAGYRLWYEPSLEYYHFLSRERLTTEYLFRTTRGTAVSAPVLRLYLSAFPSRAVGDVIRTATYRSAVLMVLHELWALAAGLLRATHEPSASIEVRRLIVGFWSCLHGVFRLVGQSRAILAQIHRLRQGNPKASER